MKRFGATVLLLCILAAGCGSMVAGEGARGSRSATLITKSEIEASGTRTVHELVQKVRPGWLIDRGTRSFESSSGMSAGVLVYMGETRLGGLEVLNQIAVEGVESVRFLNATEASNRLSGMGAGQHATGAIVITNVPQER